MGDQHNLILKTKTGVTDFSFPPRIRLESSQNERIFGNKHLITFKHPNVLVSYCLINKTRRCSLLWLPEGSRPQGTCTSQFAERKQLSDG